MTWIKLDDTCPDHPGLVGLTDAAFACWVRSLCYSSRHLTNGMIPTAALKGLGTAKAAAELVTAGRWHEAPGGWRVHDYEERQRTREQVQDERDKARDRQRRHRNVTPVSRRDTAVSHAEVTRPEVEVEESRDREGQNTWSTALTDCEHPDTSFDEFWSVYPAKKQKGAARKAWVKAIKGTDPDRIIAGARIYRSDQRVLGGFILNPATWLNGEGWDDEPSPPPRSAKSVQTETVLNGFLASVERKQLAR